ncbi:MAG: GNAT family N-acetyltransferase [Gammaproteobacteria bacterium]|nr:GNAT family N-acetyltransferase [Gammaproteobacteria bacterium]
MAEVTVNGGIRPLTGDDLQEVVAIDARVGRRRRPLFFERRLEAALREPKHFIYIGHEVAGQLRGYLQARLLEGEFGIDEPVAVLDSVGVDPECQRTGIASAMWHEFERVLRHKHIGEIQTQVDWRNFGMLRFLAAFGFLLAPRQILERAVDYVDTNDSRPVAPEPEYKEKDYSDPSGDQPGALARDLVFCRSLEQRDLASLVRIDRKVTGSEHAAFYERKLAQALHESGIRVSLVAEIDGQVVGFAMARVDFGEFDRTEPTAVLDSLGVDPGFGHRQVGSALLSQLLGNLATLRIETIRTEIDADHYDILRFLTRYGFKPAQELAFSKHLL